MSYYIAETESVAPTTWTPCKAKTIERAKRAAQSARIFQRTVAWVGIRVDGQIKPVAYRVPALEINAGWSEVRA